VPDAEILAAVAIVSAVYWLVGAVVVLGLLYITRRVL
jgi:hypothetical protein